MFLYIAKNITPMVLKTFKMKKIIFGTLVLIPLFSFVYNDNQKTESTKNINQLMDKWHKDVAEYKLVDYFDVMDSTFVFLGTAPDEKWTKQEFYKFCKPYFDKKSTWNFKPIKRFVYFSSDFKTAWFEEDLQTWMEGCRGTGVLIKRKTGWKLAHYNLTVLIENEKMKKFIKLRKKKIK